MTHFLCMAYLSLAISIVVAATGSNDPSKMFKRASKYFGALLLGSIAAGWIMYLLSE